MNDIEKAIEMLKSQIELSGMSYYNFSDEDCKLAELVIKALEKQLNGGWVPVNSGKLPENKKIVLITRSTGSVGLGFCNRNSSNHWRDGEGYLLSCPLAWRELPEPYKEDEKN